MLHTPRYSATVTYWITATMATEDKTIVHLSKDS